MQLGIPKVLSEARYEIINLIKKNFLATSQWPIFVRKMIKRKRRREREREREKKKNVSWLRF